MRADETRDAATSRAKTNDATAGEGDLGVGGAGNTGEEVGGNDGEGVINKKLVLGKMANGRKLVGKILKIERRSGASGGEMEAEQAGESGGEVRKEWEGKSPVEGIEGRIFLCLFLCCDFSIFIYLLTVNDVERQK